MLDKSSASLARRLNIPPGQHARKRKRRLSEFGVQLREKQKAKATYGLLEKQFHNLFKKVSKQKKDTGELLISFLETRLDNIVYRLGFANSRNMARQLVSHGHVLVNGKKLTIPSYQVKLTDVISLSPKIQNNSQVNLSLEEKKDILPFLERKGIAGKLKNLPSKNDVEVPFNVQLIIEYYSR